MTDDRAMGMSMADSRHEFEAWAKARSLPLDRLPNDEYAGYQVHTAWLCWQHRDADIAALRAERDAFKQTMYDELDANLRLRELGRARPDEDMTTFLERVFSERDSLHAEVERLRVALMWYADEARTLGKSVATGVHTNAVLASVTVLAADAGSRAEAAMRQEPKA